MKFKDFLQKLNEQKTFFVIGLDKKTFLGAKFKFTDNINRAYAFDTFEDAIDYEERNGNKIKGFTEIFKISNNKITQET